MSPLLAIARLRSSVVTNRAGRVPGIGITCAVSWLPASADQSLQQCASRERRDVCAVHREGFKRFGEIAWRQFGRQGKGGAN